MSRDGPSIVDTISTLKKRTNEKGVGVALSDLYKIAEATPLKIAEPKTSSEILDVVSKILLQGVANGDKYEKLKNSANIAIGIRVLKVTAQGMAVKFPKILADNFFTTQAQMTGDADVKFALLELFIVIRSYGRGSYDVLQWLKLSGASEVCFSLSLAIVDGSAKFENSDKLAKVAYTCMQALEYIGGDLNSDWANQIANFHAIDFAKAFLKIQHTSTEWRAAKQKMFSALANIIVPWKKFNQLNDQGLAEKEKDLAKAVITALTADVAKISAANAAAITKSDLPTSELRFLRNWCYNSRRLARMLVELNAHIPAITLLQMFEKLKGTETIHAAAGLLRNLARKQVRLHQTLLSNNLSEILKKILLIYPTDSALLNAVLGCMLNLISSNAGRAALFDIDGDLVGVIIPKNIESPEICELAAGILWGTISRKNGKSEKVMRQWFEAINLILRRHGGDHPGCTRRALGAIIAMLSAFPITKDLYYTTVAVTVHAIRASSEKSKLVVSDVDIITQLANRPGQ
jgi:hypothetical protein